MCRLLESIAPLCPILNSLNVGLAPLSGVFSPQPAPSSSGLSLYRLALIRFFQMNSIKGRFLKRHSPDPNSSPLAQPSRRIIGLLFPRIFRLLPSTEARVIESALSLLARLGGCFEHQRLFR